MSASLLREAAAKMRERAEVATEEAPAPWSVDPITTWGSDHEVRDRSGDCIAFSETGHNASLEAPVAEHVASWHPAVALAVADWLEVLAQHWAVNNTNLATQMDAGLTVARTYLGSDR